MADVRPFRAVRYREPLEPVLAPPYDILTEEQVVDLRDRSPHNIVHLTRPGADYEGAGRRLAGWMDSGVLEQDSEPAFFIHETRFEGRIRRDLLGVVRLQPYEDRVILPHERTHRGPKEDRLALLRATGVSLEPLWFLAEGLSSLLQEAPAGQREAFAFDGEDHLLRRVTDPGWLSRATAALSTRALLIADGHHRYETTLLYSQERNDGPDAASRYTLALITDLADPGLTVLPTHRLLRAGVAVTGGREVATLEEALAAVEGSVAAATYRGGRFQVLPLEGDVAALELHRQVVDNIIGSRDPEQYLTYTRDAEEAVRWVDEGRGIAAFFLGTPDLAAVLHAAEAGITMPQKSTYFYPKAPSGMALHRLAPERLL